MGFDPHLAEIRFGSGLSPAIEPAQSVAHMLDLLQGPDKAAERFPIEPFSEFRARMMRAQDYMKLRREMRGSPEAKQVKKALQVEKKVARQAQKRWLAMQLMRRSWTEDALRERLMGFWADHFTAQGKAGVLKRGGAPYVEESIRPHLTGSFADLLIAVTTSPVMLHYLDQEFSVGPNSEKAERRGSKAGLNENLAREVLELHTLGVDGPYDQTDVRQLAELFTGLTFSARNGTVFRKDFTEPGAETVMGVSYGGDKPRLADVHAALRDLAHHPATARHIAGKLAVHFLSDAPDPALVDQLEARFRETDGDLLQVYTALLEHPSAWQPALQNVKLPFEFMASALRALAVPPEMIGAISDPDQQEKWLTQMFVAPLRVMGQPWESPLGPDGWPEEDSAWMTPQGLAARISWALIAPGKLLPELPDPRSFVTVALGPDAPDAVQFAAKAAESRHEGIALILSAPAFQRK
ncbi:DUF1800 domain-containing protein [Thalassovita taeanensis]|uniref:Uncharacterized conserved protein, DUF1800 family n=1 Tax=Thalassovita taeanensis TaxID=657014 RepID=A0A1H9BCT4_9RHOB|nr:DUF1800 domain-containing protein [Thalassovita taeanensis]SEP86764.1 Uncharacterized conserved protein, DUF1800 family [Thalassovita taeanensis]